MVNLRSTRQAVQVPGLIPVAGVVAWYFRQVYGYLEGPGTTPFYCDVTKVGRFAVSPNELRARDEAALFRLFVAFAMFQARRDVLVMAEQRAMSLRVVAPLISPTVLSRRTARTPCAALASREAFDAGCTVGKPAGRSADCSLRPGEACHVKDASSTFNRMGDMGKLPTSAWLHLRAAGGFAGLLQAVVAQGKTPAHRAQLLVERLAALHRVGRKLATMFVSALSTPALAPGLTPWFPEIDGYALVIVDTHVARAADILRPSDAPRTYGARAAWVEGIARAIDLRVHCQGVPRYAPRMVQQALYAYGSRSNRLAWGDLCASGGGPCAECVHALCPFAKAPAPSV